MDIEHQRQGLFGVGRHQERGDRPSWPRNLDLVVKNRTLNEVSTRDTLTGLYNRRYLVDRLGQEMNRVDRYGGRLAFAMVDLDGFKPVNDKYGHVFGDRLLRAVASEISRSLRTPDVAARYGGTYITQAG